jgi:hypothetical protein
MANYFRRLISNKDVRDAVALALIAIVLLTLTYFVTVFVIRHIPAPLGSFEEMMKP